MVPQVMSSTSAGARELGPTTVSSTPGSSPPGNEAVFFVLVWRTSGDFLSGLTCGFIGFYRVLVGFWVVFLDCMPGARDFSL